LHFISGKKSDTEKENFECSIRIRYRQEKQKCSVTKKSDGWHITFVEPQNGVATGQSAVLYAGSLCLGGGVIEKVF
jgi:tRNA-specific 2-thiouridylase